jgi:endonuclease-3
VRALGGTLSAAAWKRPRADRVRAIRDRLRDAYGIPGQQPHGRPLDELVLTVLSQSTNDRNRDIAFTRLRDRFESWEEVRDAPLHEVEEAIRPGGLAPTKSRRIQEILRSIGEQPRPGDAGEAAGADDPLDLAWLAEVPVPDGQAFLTALPGVGRKTAACVLLFSIRLRDVPVHTHVGRVATRLALLRPGAGTAEQHDAMTALTPPGQELEFHLNLLRHGRHTCHSQRPACEECVLLRMCPYGRQLLRTRTRTRSRRRSGARPAG